MIQPPVDLSCRLCRTAGGEPFHQDNRDYFRCPVCRLVFVPPDQFLSPHKEKAEYDQHNNSSDDPHYRRFLRRLLDPLSECLAPNSYGLDFGSGPGPTLSVMLAEAGHNMEIFDPFYAPKNEVLQQQYDFITATEVLEHLHHPGRELDQLWGCLKPGGLLGIMTKRVIDQQAFSRWHYKSDPTHVCFFSTETFGWLATHWCASWTLPEKDVVLFTKPASLQQPATASFTHGS